MPRRRAVLRAQLDRSGGTAAPASGRRAELLSQVSQRQQPRPLARGLSGGTEAPQTRPNGRGGQPRVRARQSVAAPGGGMQNGLGPQLAARVASGAISRDQASEVAGQRGLLERAYGKNWRIKLYGGTQGMGTEHGKGMMAKLRREIQRNPENKQLQAYYAVLLKRRKQLLAAAEKQLGKPSETEVTTISAS